MVNLSRTPDAEASFSSLWSRDAMIERVRDARVS